jgi:outer membrane protein, heavy metal efflux system
LSLLIFKPRRTCAGLLLGLALCLGGTAQGQTTPTLKQALDAAWAFSPQSRAAPPRLAELQARAQAAQSYIAGAPSVNVAHRTDQLNANGGLREYEAELALPLWSPGVRASTQRQIASEQTALELQWAHARLKLAGELRELLAGLMLARTEQDLATRKHAQTLILSHDVQRRVKAGDAPRIDALQAQAAVQQAQQTVVQAEGGVLKLQNQWRALTGLSDMPTPAQALELAPELASIVVATPDSKHPALQASQAQTHISQTKLALAVLDRRDPMEVGLGVSQDRSAFGASKDTTLSFALRIPLGGENRNAPKIAAARAELDAAHAEADAISRQVQADTATATAALDTARRSEALAAERARLSAEVHALTARSYQLGEGDLPTRLRAENDKFDADLSLACARIDVQRAIAQLNQALGLLP